MDSRATQSIDVHHENSLLRTIEVTSARYLRHDGKHLPKATSSLGEPLMRMHYSDAGRAAEAERMVQQAYDIRPDPVLAKPQLITERIG